MKILVAIKQVPERDAPIALTPDGRIDEGELAWTINEPDAYALEEALQLKEKNGGEVVAVGCGPERVLATLRDALAKGADRAIHIDTGDLPQPDTLGLAHLLADACRAEAPELILTGLQSDDLGLGQTGVIVAELLGIAHATIIMQVETTGTGLRVKRELEDGWFQHVEMPLPALLTIQSGGNKLRYATLMGIKRAKLKPTATVAAEASTVGPSIELKRAYLPEKQKRTEMITGSASEISARLVEILKNEVRVL